MKDEVSIIRLAGELAARGEGFVMATVIGVKGSTPRELGAKLIWRDGPGLVGTVGGGQFESLVIDACRGFWEGKTGGTRRFVLGAEAEQCCGGVMDVFFEYVGARARLIVFGAGHVSAALARVLDGTGLELAIVDDRQDWNTEERFGAGRRVLDFDAGVALAREDPARTLVAVMTYSHDIDFDVLCGILRADALPRFVGLIGSRSKFACFRTRFAQRSISEARVDAIQCPIGVGDLGKAPEEVAISVAAQVLGVCREMDRERAGASEVPNEAPRIGAEA
jgi:xanthine dehydrogenase accessory factor